MQIPVWLSCVAPLVPVAGRLLTLIICWRAARERIDEQETQVEEHRTLIVALAGFSLAGVAIIGTQADIKYGPPLFDIVLSFLLYLGSLGVQAWKMRWWHDLLGDALRDAGNTAMLLFISRFIVTVADGLKLPTWQPWAVASVAALVWLLDTGRQLLLSARSMCAIEGRLHEAESRAAKSKVEDHQSQGC